MLQKKCRLSLPLCAFMLMRDSVLHVCYSLAWMNIKYEADNIKYSASLGWKNERPAQISGQCVGVNYAGEQLLNGVSVSQEGTLSPAGLQGQDNIFFQLKMMQVPFPSRTLHILKPLCMERAVQRWNVWLRACLNELYRSLREHNLQRYMHLAAIAFALIR